MGVFRTRSTTSSIHARNRLLSREPAGHASARSPRPTSACLASPSASASSADAGIASCPSARPTSVAERTSGRSAPSAPPAASAPRRRSTASRVSMASAIRSMNAGVSHTAPGRLAIAGPPSGPTSPARSSAPENARIGAALSPPLSARAPSPAAPSLPYATAALLVTPAWPLPVIEPLCLALEMASVSAATQCCSAALDSASST